MPAPLEIDKSQGNYFKFGDMSERSSPLKLEAREIRDWNSELIVEANRRLWTVAFPSTFSQLLAEATMSSNMLFVSWLNDPLQTAGAGLAMIYINFTTQSVLTGLNSALAVLVAVSFGQQDNRHCAMLLQRGRLICFLIFVSLFVLVLFSYRAMITLGVSEAVAGYGYEYAFIMYFSMGFHSQFDCYRQYLNSTNQSRVVKYTVLVTLIFHLCALYLVTRVFQLGIKGVAIAYLMTCILNFLIVMVYVWKYAEYRVHPFRFKFKKLLKIEYVKVYMKLAAPSIALVCAQWWAIEILQLLATRLSVVAVGCMAITTSFMNVTNQFPVALNIGATSVIGNVIGEGDRQLSKVVAVLAFV